MHVKVQKIVGRTLVHVLMLAACVFFLVPFVIMLSTSLKALKECMKYPVTWLPANWLWDNYPKVFELIPFLTYMGNSLLVTLLNMLGVALTCPLVAYSLARMEWRGKNTLFFITLAVMMIPYQVIMIPIYMIFSRMKLVGTFAPLILPQYFGIPFFIFLLRQFFKGLPKDLDDAARVDGCPEPLIYFRIFLPLCAPAILTVVIFQMLNSWNDFNGPLIYLQKSSMYTLQIGLQQFKSQHATDWPHMMAASVMTSAPIIILFFFMQKRFIEGVTFTGIKG